MVRQRCESEVIDVKERKGDGMPVQSPYAAILKFAQERGALQAHTKGSLSPLLWPLMEIKYLCRMRSVEIVALTDAHASEQGLYIARRKRSHDNIVKWSQRLRAAWEAAPSVRAEILSRRSNAARPFPMEPERRFICLNESGAPMSVSVLDSIGGQLTRAAIEAEVIKPSERFTLHGLKHRDVTATKGSPAPQAASGHQTAEMVVPYDHDVPVVAPASPP